MLLLGIICCSCLLACAFSQDQTCCDCMDDKELDLLKLIRWGCSRVDNDAKCALKKIDQIKEWLNHNSKYRILVTGRMGSGKTTFIRGLTENFVPPTDSLLPHTTKVMPYGRYHEGSNCVFFDTPGLKDDEESSNDWDYIREMVQKNGEPNLLVFAIKMDNFVFEDEDIEAMVNISSAFGWKIWQRAIFILTFANMVQKVGHTLDSAENKVFFSTLYDKRHLDVVQALRKSSVSDEVINNIPVIPVGLVSQEKIPADRREVSWVEEFWQEAFKIIRETKGTYTTSSEWADRVDDGANKHEKPKKETEGTSFMSSILTCLYYIWFVVASLFTLCGSFGLYLEHSKKKNM